NCGLISAALSQTSFENWRGNSCSQPLFAYRPSRTLTSGRKSSSSLEPRTSVLSTSAGGEAEAASAGDSPLLGNDGEGSSRTIPSLSARRHCASKSGTGFCVCQRV